ncbi:MAG TPA: PilZ domain-containing protein [Steroidobacteraceae bacterium]|nr:PilZ domain-containing protein [Steroidobacteraceae bacterium]
MSTSGISRVGTRARGRLLDVSISGAFVSTSLSIPPLSSITIELLSVIAAARRFKPIEAQVIRRTERGLGIEWKELTAASLSQLVDGGQLSSPVPETPAGIQR